jgi:hypothetical protein
MKNQNKPKFGFIPFQIPAEKKGVKKQSTETEVRIMDDQVNNLAETYRKVYQSFLNKGFTSEQSFQLLLSLINYKISVPL